MHAFQASFLLITHFQTILLLTPAVYQYPHTLQAYVSYFRAAVGSVYKYVFNLDEVPAIPPLRGYRCVLCITANAPFLFSALSLDSHTKHAPAPFHSCIYKCTYQST
jgi:hypothetical protein